MVLFWYKSTFVGEYVKINETLSEQTTIKIVGDVMLRNHIPRASKNSRSDSESLMAILSRAHSGRVEYMLSPSESPSTTPE